jgi:hypothetical protein
MDKMVIPFRSELFLLDMHVNSIANTSNIKYHLQPEDTQTPAMGQPTLPVEELGEIAHQQA